MAEIQLMTIKFSPYGQRVHIALTEKKIPFEVVNVDLGNKPQALLDANPIHKKVPAIFHNGKPLAESIVILEYLEEEFPDSSPLMPKDAYERAKVRFWADYVYKTFAIVVDSFGTKPGSPEKQAGNEAILACLKTLDSGMSSFSAEGPFFTGDKFGYVDVVMAPACTVLPILTDIGGLELPGPSEMPRLHKWVEATKAHPSVSAVIPSVEETVAFFKSMMAKKAAAAAAAPAK